MPTKDEIAEALRAVYAGRRALRLCREFEAREALAGGNAALATATVTALVADLDRMERRCAALIGVGFLTDGGLISVRASDRRTTPRPIFIHTHGATSLDIIRGRVA